MVGTWFVEEGTGRESTRSMGGGAARRELLEGRRFDLRDIRRWGVAWAKGGSLLCPFAAASTKLSPISKIYQFRQCTTLSKEVDID